MSAGGLYLAWNNCYHGAGSTLELRSLCDVASNASTYALYGNIVSGVPIPDFAAHVDVVDLQVDHALLDDWWRLAEGECRGGSLITRHYYGPERVATRP